MVPYMEFSIAGRSITAMGIARNLFVSQDSMVAWSLFSDFAHFGICHMWPFR
jgi:hypothetical protein